MAGYQKRGLEVHNAYRKQHGAPKMVLVERLNDAADSYAAKLARQQTLVHNSGLDYGENLYMSWGMNSTKEEAVKDACDSWYNEIEMYSFRSPGFSCSTGHFTAMVWKGSTQLGIGYAKVGNCICVVANYKPWPNVQGCFGDNVLQWREVEESDDEDEKEQRRLAAEKAKEEAASKEAAEAEPKSDLPSGISEAFDNSASDGEIDWSGLKDILNINLKVKSKFDGFDQGICKLMISLMTFRDGEASTIDKETFGKVWICTNNLLESYQEFDKDRSGSLDPFELKSALEEAGFKLSWKTFVILQKQLGEQGDGNFKLRAFILTFLLLSKLQILMELRSKDGGGMFEDFSMKDWINEELEKLQEE